MNMNLRTQLRITTLVAALASTAAFADPPKEDGQWRGALSSALALAAGNTKSTNFNIGADALKATKEDKLSLFLTSLYGSRDVAGKSEKTANLIRGGARYDWNLTDRTFVFGTLEAEKDQIQGLDSRLAGGAGFGYKMIKEPNLSWDLFGGVVQKQDRFTFGSRRISKSSTELMLGEESNHKISEGTSFKQKLTLFPNLSNSGELRGQFDAGFVTALGKGIGLQVTLSNRYNSEAPIGTKKSDTLLLTGITMALGAK